MKPECKSEPNRNQLLPTQEAIERLFFALQRAESICHKDPEEFIGQIPTQHRAVSYWINAQICYPGLEQAMKMFLPESHEYINSHNLCQLYEAIDKTAKAEVEPNDPEAKEKKKSKNLAKKAIENINSYYRVYHSFHRWPDRPKEKTAEEFLQNIGDMYVNWRYTLREDHDHPPMVHARFMLEIWRSLLRLGNSPWCKLYKTARVDGRIKHYFRRMFIDAADKLWLLQSARGHSAVTGCVDEWVGSVGGELTAGLYVFRHLQNPEEYPIELEGDVKVCVMKSAQGYRHQLKAGELHTSNVFDLMPDQAERCNEIYRMHFMCLDGLRWNTKSEVFEIQEEYA